MRKQASDEEMRLIKAWRIAGRRLGIRVVAPFEFRHGTAVYDCIAYLPGFGSEKGVLIKAMYPPEFVTDTDFELDATEAGYSWSFVSTSVYARFEVDKFKEALLDWGFFGDPSRKPEWLSDSAGSTLGPGNTSERTRGASKE